MGKFTGLIGIMVLLGIAYALSNNRSMIKPRLVIWGLGLLDFIWYYYFKNTIYQITISQYR